MREIAEIELAIQGGTEKIETLGESGFLHRFIFTSSSSIGEQGKVDESMREMAAIEALKSEKSEKEVRKNFHFHSVFDTQPLTLPARTSTTDGHLRSVRSPKITCL